MNSASTDSSATAAINSAVYQARLQAATTRQRQLSGTWNLYNGKRWANALETGRNPEKSVALYHAEPFEDGRINRWRIWPKSTEAYKGSANAGMIWTSSEPTGRPFHQPPDWGEELSGITATMVPLATMQQNARGEDFLQRRSRCFYTSV